MTSPLLRLAARVGYQDLRKYVEARGWSRFPSRRDDVAIYRSTKDSDIEVQIPLETSFPDYADAIYLAARRIGEFERRPSEQVLRDLLNPRRDLVRFALKAESTVAGSIDLAMGVALHFGAVKALRASACSAQRPRRFHPRMTLGEAEAYVNACRLGQTEVGSYVLSIDTPLETRGQIDVTEIPFGRRATQQLFEATDFVARSLRHGEPARVLDDERSLVSANLCEALVDMLPADEAADLRLACTWSPLLPCPPSFPSRVLIDRPMFEDLEQLAAQLRPRAGTEPVQFVGMVIELSAAPNVEARLEGDVVLQVQLDDQLAKVRVPLAADDYATALRAHAEQRYVSVKGTIRRGGRINHLEKPTDFALLG